MAKPKPNCLIDIDLANAINQLLYKAAAGGHNAKHGNPGFRCPLCKQLVTVNKKGKKSPRVAYFKHFPANPSCDYYKPRRA
jgi:hypothetical protein